MTQERALAGALSGTLGTLLEGMLSELVWFSRQKSIATPTSATRPAMHHGIGDFHVPGTIPAAQHRTHSIEDAQHSRIRKT